MSTLKKGSTIHTETGQSLQILQCIGEGGQGFVYKVEFGGKMYALKWYKKTGYLDNINKDAFKQNLAKNISDGSPAQQFLWPQALTEEKDGAFGYLMNLYPEGYTGLEDYYWGSAYFPSWLAVIDTALCLIEGFMILHRTGKSYQDLNFGGFRANPIVSGAGKVLICDNDNVAPYGTNLGILGLPEFMAPEVITGKSFPDTQTDLHSLAVVLFGLFFRGHPLEGKHTLAYAALCTQGIQKIIYGESPIFCYNPVDDRNRPDDVVHRNGVMHYWPLFTKEFKEYFVKAFTLGLSDPYKRVLETEWRKALIGLRSSLSYIQRGNTSQEQFLNPYSETMPLGCLRIRFSDGQMAVLSHGARLYACQTTDKLDQFRTVTASVAMYQNDPQRLVMRNDSSDVWRYILPGQMPEQVMPQGIFPIVPGSNISFSGREAVII